MKAAKKIPDHSFLPVTTFIEYKKKLAELKAALHIKKSSAAEACRILDKYINSSHKISADILHMREE